MRSARPDNTTTAPDDDTEELELDEIAAELDDWAALLDDGAELLDDVPDEATDEEAAATCDEDVDPLPDEPPAAELVADCADAEAGLELDATPLEVAAAEEGEAAEEDDDDDDLPVAQTPPEHSSPWRQSVVRLQAKRHSPAWQTCSSGHDPRVPHVSPAGHPARMPTRTTPERHPTRPI